MRVLIVGLAGAGKTTIANCLGTATSTPVHLLDELVWVGGVLMSYEDQLALGQEIADQDDWIVDGYLGWTPPLLEAAHAIVSMRTPLRTALWWTFWRHVKAELRRNNTFPGWRRLFRFMRIVSRQYRSTEIPASLEEPLVSQAAIDRALNPYWDKLLVNPSLTQIIGFTDR